MPTHHALAQEADAMKRYAITLTRDVHSLAQVDAAARRCPPAGLAVHDDAQSAC